MAKNDQIKNLFRTFVRQASDADQEEPRDKAAEEVLTTEEIQAEAAPQAQPQDKGRPLKGSMLQLWGKWAGKRPAPMLSLTAGIPEGTVRLDRQELERESVRVMVQLEQEAKKRLKELGDAEEKAEKAARELAEKRAKARAEGREEPPESMEEQIAVNVNATCSVCVSRDKMICWAFLFPPVGGGTLPADIVGKAISGAGVTSGIQTEALLRLVMEKPYFELVPVAIGTPVTEGENGKVIDRFARELPFEIKINDEGLADYKHTNYVRQVYKDDVICDIMLPVEGQPGLKVDGSVLAPKPVKKAKVPKGANTVITEDGLRLISGIDGHLEYKREVFNVRPVLTVEGDVDYVVGNIEFNGDVHITGDVRENFSVSATGSVSIDGLVEAATVEAGGDLVISRGVVGDNRAMLRSGGCVRVKYLENCVVYAGSGVYADCVMNSQIFSDSSIEVTTGRGSVIGGALTAAKSVKAKMIGAQSGRRTEVTLGVLPYIQQELVNIEDDIRTNRAEQARVEKDLAFLEREQGMEGSDARLAKARMRHSVLELKEQQLLKRKEKLEPMAPNVSDCRLECDVIYPVTRLVVREAVWMVKEVRKHCKVRYDEYLEQIVDVF